MPAIQQPVGQVRLTNVAIVRLRKGKKKFEVAAYPNKVLNWRNKIETDINEVLQVHSVFTDVSRGVHAKKEDLQEAFGTVDHLQAALQVLQHGELEVGEKERQSALESLFRDIATIVAEKCLNPDTGRPYTVTIIEKALKEAHFNVQVDAQGKGTKSAKQQALVAIKLLQEHIPIARARMKLRITCDALVASAVKDVILAQRPEWEGQGQGGQGGEGGVVVGAGRVAYEPIVDPGAYRLIEDGVRSSGLVSVSVEVLSLAVGAASSSAASASASASAAAGGAGGAPRRGALQGGKAGPEEGSDEEVEAEEEGDVRRASSALGLLSVASGPAPAPAPAPAAGAGAASTGTVRRVAQPGRRLACGSCGAAFEGDSAAEDHRAHHRSDWHRFNLKRKVKGQGPVTEQEYADMPVKEREAFLNTDV